MSFRPNQSGVLMRKLAKRDIHGRESFAPGVPVSIAIVHLADKVVETSVRADSSATRGAADMSTLQAKILIGTSVLISRGDVMLVRGRYVEIESIHDRIDVLGRPHHQELGGNIKGDL